MLRQRVRTATSPFALVGSIVVFLVACALVYYGAMVALLALKVDPGRLNAISGYRSAYDFLAGLQAGDLSDTLRIVAGIVGLLALLAFTYLALKALPRPYLARHELELDADERGMVTVQPRAVERVAEAAAVQDPAVASASGRYGGDELAVAVSVRRARDVAATLEDAQARVVAALEQHGLPPATVNLTLTGFERRTRRELD